MTDPEIRNQMEFILNQQAQSAVIVQRLSESQEQIKERVSRLEGAFVGLVNIIGETHKATQAKLEVLAQAQIVMEGALKETNERLNTFIDVVERHITEGRNGHLNN